MKTWRRWVALLDRREAGTSLALFRVAIGLCVLGTIGTVLAHDLVTVLWVDREWGGYRSLGKGSWLVELLGGPRPAVIWALVAVSLVGGLLLTVGLASRLGALLSLQGVLALTWVNGHAGGSYDDLLTNALWLLLLADAGATLSLSCRLRTGRWTSERPVPSWPRWLAVLQLVLMYASSGSQKLSSYWVPGGDFSALYYILQQPSWQRVDMRWVAPWFPVTQAATALTWAWEVSSPLLLWVYWLRLTEHRPGRLRALVRSHDPRLLFAGIGVPMHLGTLLLMNVGPFSALSLSYYLCLWHPDEWRALGPRLAGWLKRPGMAAASSTPQLPAPPSHRAGTDPPAA